MEQSTGTHRPPGWSDPISRTPATRNGGFFVTHPQSSISKTTIAFSWNHVAFFCRLASLADKHSEQKEL